MERLVNRTPNVEQMAQPLTHGGGGNLLHFSARESDAPAVGMLNDRFEEFSKAAPIASLFKLVIDPVMVVATLLVLARAFDLAYDGYVIILAVIAFLLSALILEGTFLFVPGYSRPLLGMARFATGWLLICALVIMIGWATHWSVYYDENFVLAWMILAPVSLVATHWLIRVGFLFKEGRAQANAATRKVVVIGANKMGRALARRIQHSALQNMTFLGFFDDRGLDRLEGVKEEEMLGGLDRLPEFIRSNDVHELYISLPMTKQPRVMQMLDEMHDTTVSIFFVLDFSVFDLIQARFELAAGMPVVAVCESPFLGLRGLAKRFSDIVLATLILLLIWPVMLAVAIAVKLTSKGPVFFTQQRYGADGERITVYKFRSMKVHSEHAGTVTQATRNDPRLTPIGGFLRRTSLDELPQFINVLEGKMSIVGPRPHANAHNEMYRKLIKGYMMRYKVKPGITGWAQVNGYRGETETLEKMQKRIEYDLDYLRNWSLWLDIKIILATVMMIIRDKNAY
ncbi:undecaprenyl-phosphate glucose phosphotransferase [Silvimonas amylolytica]|uniref:Undecaprenyl-phosphate glucose phosphotransferase n=1 Tax=Silvimonas amylolytica TaxID=449663 RepID=A0ABQ2PQJ6_9NEIS|nr:undecaprenyl-phosphate glucose phosphotransferase [Silvimonas amylolytica]GGP27889.1 undecaprenyl-phosphate glucose phosphotransferase [Silvimonas amylolytica]